MMTVHCQPLANFTNGDKVYIEKLNMEGTMKRRLLDLGFIPGAMVKVLQKSPLGDPTAYRVSNTVIALRKEEGLQILGRKMEENHNG